MKCKRIYVLNALRGGERYGIRRDSLPTSRESTLRVVKVCIYMYVCECAGKLKMGREKYEGKKGFRLFIHFFFFFFSCGIEAQGFSR